MTPETRIAPPNTPLTSAMSDPGTHVLAHKTRLRFWELDNCFKCPVIGMCLTSTEQKHLIKKVGMSMKKKRSPFELHEILVCSAESENRLSVKIDNLLERKFRKAAETLNTLDDAVFLNRFKAAFAAGDCLAILWTAAVNPELPIEVKREIFGDIHMAMHWSGEQSLMLKRKQTHQERALEKTQERLTKVSRERRALHEDNEALHKENARLSADLAALKKENAMLDAKGQKALPSNRLRQFEAETLTLESSLSKLRTQLKKKQCQVDTLKYKNRRLRDHALEQTKINQRLKEETRSIIAELTSLNHCDASCPAFDLCKKRILIVGGVTRMETVYRELIEGRGGRFEYHNGYMKNGVRQLEARLKRADMVLCPVNCNSHAACSLVKNLSKKHKKPVHMLPNSSLNTVSQVIWGERACNYTLN